MNNNVVPKARKENLVVQELNGEVLIYDLDTNKAFCLNEASMRVWQACDGNKNVSEIRSALSKQFNSQINDDFVWLALDQLKKENLIENKDEVVADFNGMSRREVIRKVGIASVIALPLISSLVAPPAISAQSVSCNTGTSCTCPNGTGTGNTCKANCTAANANCLCRNVTCNGGGNNCVGTCAAA